MTPKRTSQLVPLPGDPPGPAAHQTRSTGICRRPELIPTLIRHRHESAVVLKDPVAMNYLRLRPDEFFVWQCLDGRQTLQDLCDAYRNEYPDRKVSLAEMNDLLFRFHGLGLTVSNSLEQGDRLLEKHKTQRDRRWMSYLSSVLFIRFPGVDPEPTLRRLYPVVRPLFGLGGLSILAILVVSALLTLAGQWDRFMAEFPSMQHWLSVRAVVTLGMVIGAVKVLHELGHALVCKHFGGECHQIGPMLLVFTPALYCDTSDSWTLPNRFARASVGLAGIAAEIILASLATLMWAVSGSSLPHYLAMNVMLVCSVSTLLFNANPLLRYDGYYVLSDLCDVPNLGQKSRENLASLVAHWGFGVPESSSDSASPKERFWLVTYASLAFFYRWFLTGLILWFLVRMLQPYRLESVGNLICLAAVSGLVFTSVRPVFQFLRHPGKRRQIKMRRLAMTAVLLSGLGALAFYPFPSSESAAGKLIPRVETSVFASTDGLLEQVLAEPGQRVIKGQTLAVLSNADTTLQFDQASARAESQQVLVEALRSSQVELPESANDLPAAEAMLRELQRQLATRRARLEALQINAPAEGVLIESPKRIAEPVDEIALIRWTGAATDKKNRGCLIESGTELFTIRGDEGWDVEFVVDSAAARRLQVGNLAKFV
ncbi:MAG: biotin/lipoyl-binding protein, partial [Planctomycetota bacterium]